MNKVLLSGRIAGETEITSTPNGKEVCKFKIAVPRRNDRKVADFIECVSYSNTAKYIHEYCEKGDSIVIEGHWESGSYTNKQGVKVYTNRCIVEIVEKTSFKKEIRIEEGDYLQEPVEDLKEDDEVREIDITEDELPF